jgi:hypothetical protein
MNGADVCVKMARLRKLFVAVIAFEALFFVVNRSNVRHHVTSLRKRLLAFSRKGLNKPDGPQCEICLKRFDSKRNLQTHRETIHEKRRDHVETSHVALPCSDSEALIRFLFEKRWSKHLSFFCMCMVCLWRFSDWVQLSAQKIKVVVCKNNNKLKSTCGARWPGQTRRTPPSRSTSAGTWRARRESSRRSRPSTCALAAQ